MRIIVIVILLAWGGRAFGGKAPDATMFGNLDKVKALVKSNPKLPFTKFYGGFSPLHWAVLDGNKEVVEFLLTNKADVNVTNDSGRTPLHYAAQSGKRDIVELLLTNNADVNIRDCTGYTPLLCAVFYGHKDVAAALLAKGADINATDHWDITPLLQAANDDHKDIVELLLTNNADINARDKNGWTALYYAAFVGDKDVVSLLLERGSDVNAADKYGETPLSSSVEACYTKVYSGNDTLLYDGASSKRKDMIEFLLAKGADANARNKWGNSPLYDVAYTDCVDIAKLLVAKGADINDKVGGYTPLDVAIANNRANMVEFLQQHGALSGKDASIADGLHAPQ